MPLHLLRDSPAKFLQIFSHSDTLMLLWHPKLKTGRVCLLVESSACSCISHLASYLRVHSIHPGIASGFVTILLAIYMNGLCHSSLAIISLFLSLISLHPLTGVGPLSPHQKHGRVSGSPHHLQHNQRPLQSKPPVILQNKCKALGREKRK